MFDLALQLALAVAVSAGAAGKASPACDLASGMIQTADGCRPLAAAQAPPAPPLQVPAAQAPRPPAAQLLPLAAPPPPAVRPQIAQTPPPAIPPAASAAPQPGQPMTPAEQAALREELQLWTSIKDSKEPAEFEAFLAAFPNGRLAQVARLRLAALRNPQTAAPPAQPQQPPQPRPPQQASQPVPPAPQAPAAPFELTAAAIAEAQERLYNLNYDVGAINGRAGPDTNKAIAAFQSRVSLPSTGVLDAATMQRLRAARIADKWVAMAFTARGAYGFAWGRPNRKQAETDAIEICRKHARGVKCNTVTGGGSSCSALSTFNTRRRVGAYAVTRADKDTARTAALEYCRANSPSPDACEISALACADGSHQ